jgi:glycosyltransferase involved in cell wall biosynthesis
MGHFTVVVTSYEDDGPKKEYVDNGVIYRTYKKEDIGLKKITDYVLQKANQYRVDWIEGVDRLGESTDLILQKKRPPVVIKAHYNDVLKCSRYSQIHYCWQKWMIDLACFRYRERLRREALSLKMTDVLITPCRKILEEMNAQGLPLAKKQCVIPNPITPLSNWSNDEADNPTILLVSRIDVGKGIAYLPRLVESLKQRFPKFCLEIAGGDSYARFIGSTQRWLSNKLKMNSRHVRFLGHLDEMNLDQAYSRAWVVIVPSRWDTFPTTVLEAMARSKPIVASPHGGMPEMLEGTDNCIANPAKSDFVDVISMLLSNKEYRMQAGASGLKKIFTVYHPERICKLYINTISNLVM